MWEKYQKREYDREASKKRRVHNENKLIQDGMKALYRGKTKNMEYIGDWIT